MGGSVGILGRGVGWGCPASSARGPAPLLQPGRDGAVRQRGLLGGPCRLQVSHRWVAFELVLLVLSLCHADRTLVLYLPLSIAKWQPHHCLLQSSMPVFFLLYFFISRFLLAQRTSICARCGLFPPALFPCRLSARFGSSNSNSPS